MRTAIGTVVVVLAMMPAFTGFASATGAMQDVQPMESLVEEFERAGFGTQLALGKRIVSRHDKRVLDRLERWLNHQDRHVRANVALVFAGLGDQRGFQTLAGILSDRSDRPAGQGQVSAKWSPAQQIRSDRYYAVHVLGSVRDRQAVDLLLPLLSDPDVSYKAAWALGENGDPRAIRPLIDALRDKDALVRISAIHALEKLQAREALPHLRALLNDPALPSAGDQITVARTAQTAIVAIEKQR